MVCKLGAGQFGKVYMVKNRKNPKDVYALKCIEKNKIV